MKEGIWVLFDGFESAPPEMAQKLTSLCGNNPEIHLIENGKDICYSKQKEPIINDNFHLFFTYNPSSQKGNLYLDPIFVNKCISFSLPQIDSTPKYSAQVLHGLLIKSLYKNDVATEIAIRMSMAHDIAKKKSLNSYDYFAGDIQFTGRTLKFIASEFKKYIDKNRDNYKDLYVPICNSFNLYYWNSEILRDDSSLLKKEMIDEFSKPINNEIVVNINHKSDDYKVRNQDILRNLRDIQINACTKSNESSFSYEFIKKCRTIKLSDIRHFIDDIQDTLMIIKKQCKLSEKIYLVEYPHLKIILQILIQINEIAPTVNDQLINLELFSNELLAIKELENPLMKLYLLEKLQEENFSIFNVNSPLFYIDEIWDLFRSIIRMQQNQEISNFGLFISSLSKNQDFLPYIESIFPYSLFENSKLKMLCYYIPMFLELYNKRVTFHVQVENEVYDFIGSEMKWFEPIYVFDMKIKDDLLLYPGTELKKRQSYEPINNKEKLQKHQKDGDDALYEYLIDISKQKYNLTMHILSNNISKLNRREKEQVSNKSLISKTYQKTKITLLFSNNSNPKSMIANIWSLIYLMPENFFDDIKEYFHPLEFEMIRHFTKFYKSINQNNINDVLELTNWMNNNNNNFSFGNDNSYLRKYYDRKYQVNKQMPENIIKNNINLVKNEIIYLQSIPKIGISMEKFINILKDNVIKPLKLMNENITLSNNEKEIINKLNQLQINIDEIKISQNNHSHRIFVQNLKKMINDAIKNPTQVLYDRCYNYSEEYKRYVNKTNSMKFDLNFIWPFSSTASISEDSYTEEIRLYQHILWYSQVFSKIEKISANNDIQKYLEISEMENMEGISSYIIYKICKNKKKFGIGIENMDILKSTLNAHFICRLINDNLIDKISGLDQILNNLEKRVSNHQEIQWINQISNKYPLDFNIVLPQFTPYDVFSLFVSVENNESIATGPLLNIINSDFPKEKIKNNKIEISLSSFLNNFFVMDDEFGFEKNAVLVDIKIYQILISSDDDIPDDITKFKSFINHKIEEYENDIETKLILNKLLYILDIANSMSKCSKYNFTFNDTLFLKKEWFLNEQFVNKYPSFLYWLILNNDCLKQLQRNFGFYEYSNKKLPFWLFAIRIMSSNECVKFYCKNDTELAYLIKNAIDEKVLQILNCETRPKLGTKWINFLLPKVPSEIFDNNCKLFYQFFYNLSTDFSKNTPFVKKKKKNIITNFAVNATLLVLENKVDEFLDYKFDRVEYYNLLSFILDPQIYIQHEITKDIKSILSEFIESSYFVNLDNYSSEINKNFCIFLNYLKQKYFEESEKIKNEYINEKNRRMQLMKDSLKKK